MKKIDWINQNPNLTEEQKSDLRLHVRVGRVVVLLFYVIALIVLYFVLKWFLGLLPLKEWVPFILAGCMFIASYRIAIYMLFMSDSISEKMISGKIRNFTNNK